MNCIITGCALILEDNWAACDVFQAGDHYVFNANTKDGQVCWMPMVDKFYTKEIDITGTNYWERRGIFIVPRAEAQPNQAALDYML